MRNFSFRKYLTFLFLSLLMIVVTISRNETLKHGIKKLSCVSKKSDKDILDELYFADLMNNFEDFGYNEWDYNLYYDREQGYLILDSDQDNEKVECQSERENSEQLEREKFRKNSIYVINEINKQELLYYSQEFFDL
jgi:hypothetical protein